LQGQGYYRIVQNDNDGSAGYSAIRTVNIDFLFLVSIVPNPFNGSATIQISNPLQTEVDIEVIDVCGRTVFVKHGITSTRTIEFGQELASGLYLVKVTHEGHLQTIKVVKN